MVRTCAFRTGKAAKRREEEIPSQPASESGLREQMTASSSQSDIGGGASRSGLFKKATAYFSIRSCYGREVVGLRKK